MNGKKKFTINLSQNRDFSLPSGMSCRADRINEIAHQGQRSWDKEKDARGDAGIFLSHYVEPLRRLQRDGLFPQLDEHAGTYNGVAIPDKVWVVGDIAPNFEN